MNFYTDVRVVGNNILVRGVKQGNRYSRRTQYKPKYLVKSDSRDKKTVWKTLQNESLEELQFSSISDAREFKRNYEKVDNFPIYGDLRIDHCFISDNFGDEIVWDIDCVCVSFLDIEVDSTNGFPDPARASEKITAITLTIGEQYYALGTGKFTTEKENVRYIKCEDEIELLEKFLEIWSLHYPDILSGWNVKFFDVPYLVNRMKRLFGDRELEKNLSPWKKISDYEVKKMNNIQQSYDILGVSVLDYYDLYKKYSGRSVQESYKLDYIAFVELGEKKIDYSEYSNLQQLYLSDYQKFIEYNIKDVELVYRLEQKLKLLELVMTLAYDARVNYEDVLSQTRMWDAIIYNHLKKKKIAIPPKKNIYKDSQYEGAYVKDPQIGMHHWVASFDLNSLYPMLIQQYNISSETKVNATDVYRAVKSNYFDHLNDEEKEELEKLLLFLIENSSDVILSSILAKKLKTDVLKKCGLTFTPNGQLFRTNEQGFLSELMSKMYDGRVEFKTNMLIAKRELERTEDSLKREQLQRQIARCNNIQLAKKVTLNSAYGAIGSSYFRFFDLKIAEAITYSGQLSIKWIELKLNAFLNDLLKTKDFDYVIASDTDSIILNLGPVVNNVFKDQSDKRKIIRFMDKICEETLTNNINESYEELAQYMNVYSQKMIMKREALADKAIWTAKKKYMMHVYNNENVEYSEPQLKIMGMEAIKSSTPNVCRDKIKQALKIMAEKEESDLMKFVAEFQEEFKSLSPEEIAFPRGVSNVTKYKDKLSVYNKGTPIHVKGSLLYNKALLDLELEKKYEIIKDGEKIKYLYLKTPNNIQSPVIAFPNVLPKEFDLHQNIDYDTQYEKAFLDPLKLILNAIGWRYEKGNSLEDFFS